MKEILKFLALSLIIFIFGQTSLFPPLKAKVWQIFSPIQYGTSALRLGLKNQVEFLGKIGSLRRENEELQERATTLESELVTLKEVARENEILKDQLGLLAEGGENPQVLAQIIGRSGLGTETLINKGAKEGIKKGDVAFFGGNLLGMVEEVGEGSALVRLTFHPQLRVAVLDQDSPGRARGIVSGSFGKKLFMERILPAERVEEGDLIITSGEDGKFPKGLIVGRIERVEVEEGGVLQKAILRAEIDFSKLEEVFVGMR